MIKCYSVFEAVQLTWGTWDEICDFVPKPIFIIGCYLDFEGNETNNTNGRIGLKILLNRDVVIVEQDDWILKDSDGNFLIKKSNVFQKDYYNMEN